MKKLTEQEQLEIVNEAIETSNNISLPLTKLYAVIAELSTEDLLEVFGGVAGAVLERVGKEMYFDLIDTLQKLPELVEKAKKSNGVSQ